MEGAGERDVVVERVGERRVAAGLGLSSKVVGVVGTLVLHLIRSLHLLQRRLFGLSAGW